MTCVHHSAVIGIGLFASLGLHTMPTQRRTWVAGVGCSVHITQSMSIVDSLHRLLLVHISKLVRTNRRQHHLFLVLIGQVSLANGTQH